MVLRALQCLPLKFSGFVFLFLSFLIPAPVVLAQAPPTVRSPEVDRGVQLFVGGNYQQAVEVLRKAAKTHREEYDLWYYLGLSQIRTNDLKNATTSFETALRLQPKSSAAQAGIAHTLVLRNKLSDALRAAKETLVLNPESADAHYVLGVIQLRNGHAEDAVKEAEEALKRDPDIAVAYLLKSQALVRFVAGVTVDTFNETKDQRIQRYGQAEAALREYLRRVPNSPQKATWEEQLAAMHAVSNPLQAGIVSSKEVTTKARVLNKPEPIYTGRARANQVTGTVILRGVFMADGTVKHIFVVNALPDGLTEEAIKAARRIKFVPATKDGKPVSMWMQLEYNFNLY